MAEPVHPSSSAMFFERKKFLALLDDIGMRQVKTLVLAHRDRLTRFGFEWFERYAKRNGCEGIVLNRRGFLRSRKWCRT